VEVQVLSCAFATNEKSGMDPCRIFFARDLSTRSTTVVIPAEAGIQSPVPILAFAKMTERWIIP
jgi:hypothetical protein